MATASWTKLKLDEICTMKYGVMPKKSDLVEEGYPVFSGYRIVGYHKTYLYEKPEIVVIARGVGGTGDVKLSPPKAYITNLSIVLQLKTKDVIKKFLYYQLSSRNLRILDSGAAQSQITITDLKNYEVQLPSPSTQQKIASILSAYDALIENNLKRIKILEEMAQMIYREWFVNFRFPGYEKVKMVKSDLGMIPEGWEVKKLGDFVELAYGKALKADDRRDGKVPVFGSGGICGYHDKALVKWPGIIVGRKGNVGSVFWSDDDFHPIDTVFYVKTELELHYVYYNLLNQNFFNTDAAVPGLNRNQAYSNKFLHPDEVLMKTFAEFINAIFEQKKTLKVKNDNLRKTRDLLLPKLINGEIDVEKLDIKLANSKAA